MPPQQHRTVEQHTYNIEQHSLPQNDRQKEMDMGDGDLADSRANATTILPESFGQNNNNYTTGMLQHQKGDIAVTTSSDRTDSVSSYNPPSATPPESGEIAAEPSNGVQTLSDMVDETSKYQGRGAFEMRELAKGALLSLAPHNIKFSDLLAEGINAQLLSQLFEEVGLKPTPTITSKTSVSNSFLTVESRIANPTTSKSSPATNLTSDSQHPVDVKEPATLAVSAAPATNTGLRQHAGNRASIASAATKAADNQSLASPAMERKDVIAAMLAAKMGKPIPRKESPGAAPLSLPAKVIPAPLIAALSTSEPPRQSTQPSPTNTPSQIVVDEPTIKPTPKPRSKAQTELVRQRMEQLKRESVAKAQAQEASQMLQSPAEARSASGLVTGLSTYPLASLPPKPVSQEVVMGNTPMSLVTSNTVREVVPASAGPSSATFTSSIPGLFMMDADPDPVFIPPLEKDSLTTFFAALDNTNQAESISLSETAHGTRTQQLVALDLDAVSRETSNSRNPSKRPLAVDAFDDEDLPPAKQQNSRSSSSREKDSASNDRYSDEISEGEIMEIEEGSPVSPLPKAPASRPFPVPSDESAAWPPASTSPPTVVHRQDSASNRGSTEVSGRLDVNGQRSVPLSRHDLELEAMKKKLAEAEERKKAKQHESQLQSPAPLPVNQPLMSTMSSPLALSATNAVSVTGMRQQTSQKSTSAVQGNVQPSSNGLGSKSPMPSTPVDSVQRAKELREKLLRQRMLKQGLPELDKEVQKTQNRQAEAQARLAQLRREAEKREEEAREARKREQEIMEEVKRLEQQLEMGMNGQQQFSQEMETLDQEMSPQAVRSAEEESESQPIATQPLPIATPAAENLPRDAINDNLQSVDNNEQLAEQDNAPESGDSISDSEDEPLRQVYNNRRVRPSAEAALPTAEEEAAFLRAATVDESVSDGEGVSSPEDSDHHRETKTSPRRESQSDSEDSPMEVDSDSDGSASMSDSGSEDYQPAEPIISTENLEAVDDEDEEYDPMEAPIPNIQPLLPEEDQEDYEPSEIVDPLEVRTIPAAMPQDQAGSQVSNDTASGNEPEHGDDREHGLELTEANTLINPQELLPSVSDAADTNNVRMHVSILQYCLTLSRTPLLLNPLLPISPLTRVP